MRLVRARTLVMLDRNAEAVVDFGKALAAGPSIEVYAGRSLARKIIDPKGALADADAAVALDAKSSWARSVRAQRLADAERYDAAVAEMTTAIAGGETPQLLVSRADVYRKWKKLDLAVADLRRARTLAKDGEDHNTLCWWEATTSFSLDTALGDCDAALALDPNQSSYIDSRGMALLQLGRNGDAIAAFDRALSLSPFLPASLYARGIAKLRAGDRPGARADITAARNFAPGIAKSYAEYGIAVPTL
jgi:tetratricopeptide (TPR) repeat protein